MVILSANQLWAAFSGSGGHSQRAVRLRLSTRHKLQSDAVHRKNSHAR
jgi:hypothetical protein